MLLKIAQVNQLKKAVCEDCIVIHESKMGSFNDNGDEGTERMALFMRQLIARYETTRGKDPKELGIPFWDLVIISAGDKSQEEWYSSQLQLKLENGELPLSVPFRCISDPQGCRIGAGGSTLHILNRVTEIYGKDLFKWKILMIHAGGYSKRLPSHSCSGKIFSPLPIASSESKVFQMLDLKLLMYLPFLEMMNPGSIFITASDDIAVYDLTDGNFTSTENPAVISLAHPSNLHIGTTHGVFLLPEESYESSDKTLIVSSCLEVLQKPSVPKMKEKGVIFTDKTKQQRVYSDSGFWITKDVIRKFLDFYNAMKPISVESCIYGDFMICQGTSPSHDHVRHLTSTNGDSVSPSLDFKRRVCEMMQSIPLTILGLPVSKFYHIGTMKEYVDALQPDNVLWTELNLSQDVCNKWTGEEKTSQRKGTLLGTVLSCRLPRSTKITSKTAVLEYTIIDCPELEVGDNTIISNCHIAKDFPLDHVPSGFLFHTIPIISNNPAEKFVTVAFNISDDLKHSTDNISDLLFAGVSLSEYDSNPLNLFPGPPYCIWDGRLFRAFGTMEESFAETVAFIRMERKDWGGEARFSMNELIAKKDCSAMLNFRRTLHDSIVG